MTGIELLTIGSTAITVGDAALTVGTLVGAGSAIAQGQQQAAWADYNAAVARNEQIATRQAARFEEARLREKERRVLSSQEAAFGAAGVTGEGTPLLLRTQTAEDVELDALAIRYSGSVAAARAGADAAVSRLRGRSRRAGGFVRAGSTLLTGASRVTGNAAPGDVLMIDTRTGEIIRDRNTRSTLPQAVQPATGSGRKTGLGG